MDDLSGGTIRGYDLIMRLGEGAYGAVYRAYQPQVQREVAIKIIQPRYASQPDFIRRFEVEAHLVAQLEHLHIVPLYDYWRDPEGAYPCDAPDEGRQPRCKAREWTPGVGVFNPAGGSDILRT